MCPMSCRQRPVKRWEWIWEKMSWPSPLRVNCFAWGSSSETGSILGTRKCLQSNGSQSAKQTLRHISGRERCRLKYVTHCVAKQIVQEVKESGCAQLVMENLKNIQERIRAGKKCARDLSKDLTACSDRGMQDS